MRQPRLNLQMARTYLTACDATIAARTWQQVMNEIVKDKTGSTRRRWDTAVKDNRAWTFATQTGQRTPDGKPAWIRLVYAGETKIRRHVKLRRDAYPFDPQWRPYFEERALRTKFGIHRHKAGIKPS
jgi:hypothetical protein